MYFTEVPHIFWGNLRMMTPLTEKWKLEKELLGGAEDITHRTKQIFGYGNIELISSTACFPKHFWESPKLEVTPSTGS